MEQILPGVRYGAYEAFTIPERIDQIKKLPPKVLKRVFPGVFAVKRRQDPIAQAAKQKVISFQETNAEQIKKIIAEVLESYSKQKFDETPVSSQELAWMRKKMIKALNPFRQKQLLAVGLDFAKEFFMHLVNDDPPPDDFTNKLRENDRSKDKYHFSMGDFNELRGSVVAKHLELSPKDQVQGFIRSKHRDEKDLSGIDFFIIVNKEKTDYVIPIQAKSSDQAVESFYNYHHYIPALNISRFKLSSLLKIFRSIIADRLERAGKEDSPRIISKQALNQNKRRLRAFLLSTYRTDEFAKQEVKRLIHNN